MEFHNDIVLATLANLIAEPAGADALLSHLLEEHIISCGESEIIKSIRIPHLKSKHLFSIILRKGEDKIQDFFWCLKINEPNAYTKIFSSNEIYIQLKTKDGMAHRLAEQGKFVETLALYKEVLEMQEQILGKEYPETILTKHHIASTLNHMGKLDAALEMYKEVLEVKERVYGRESPCTLETKNRIALTIQKQGKLHEALAILKEVVKVQERVLGKESLFTRIAKHNIESLEHSMTSNNGVLEPIDEVDETNSCPERALIQNRTFNKNGGVNGPSRRIGHIHHNFKI